MLRRPRQTGTERRELRAAGGIGGATAGQIIGPKRRGRLPGYGAVDQVPAGEMGIKLGLIR